MKKILLLAAASLFLLPWATNAQNTKKWYVAANVQGNFMKAGVSKDWSAAAGIGIHRMLGEYVSVGLSAAYAGAGYSAGTVFGDREHTNGIGGELNFAGFVRLTDKLYYVPEIAVGLVHEFSLDDEYYEATDSKRTTFGGGISPFGLEFRPWERVGFRTNIFSVTYSKSLGQDTWNISLIPTFSVIFRF